MGSSWYYWFGSSPFQDTMKEPTLSTTQVQDLSVEWGDNVYQNLPYTYEGTFYDDSDGSFTYTNAKIEFTYIPDSIVNNEYTITENFTNSETKNPNEISDLTFYENTTVYDSTKMVSDDNAYSYFDRENLNIYNATYTFTNDTVGSDPTNWTVGDETGGTISVIYELDGHNKVLDLHDTNNPNILQIYNGFTSQTSGYIEWWWCSDDVTDASSFLIRDNAVGDSISLGINTELLRFYYSGWQDIMSVYDNTWYHCKVYFEIGIGWDLWVNGIKEVDDQAFNGATTKIDEFRFQTGTTYLNYHCYVDAVDYSWTAGYIQNRSADFLYSFENYPATYSFENETIYSRGTNIEFIDEDGCDTNCTLSILNRIEDHDKVLQCYDKSSSGRCEFSHNFTVQTYGSIEFWFLSSDVSNPVQCRLRTGADITVIYIFRLSGGDIQYYDSGWITYDTGINNKWYHIIVDFECSAGGYMGLSQYDYHIRINGTKYTDLDFFSNEANIEEFFFFGDITSLDSYCYFDAYGESCDTSYKVGGNAFWHYYYDQDSNFENENVGTEGINISFVDIDNSGASAIVEIAPEFSEHRKVIRLTADAGGDNAEIKNNITGGKITGTIEQYMKTTDCTNLNYIIVQNQDSINAIQFMIDGDKFYFKNNLGSDIEITGIVPVDNTWYHIKFIFDCTTDEYDIYINNVLRYNDAEFNNPATTLDYYRLVVPDDIAYSMCIDAVSYSWTSGNEEGDNLRCNIEMITNFTIDLPFSLCNTRDIIHVSVDSRHFTSISTNMTLSIFNWSSSSWIQISNTRDISEILHEFDYTDFSGIVGLIASNGTIRMKYYGFNCSAYNLRIDQLTVSIYSKTTLEYEHTLILLGTWKYRFELNIGLGSSYNSSWVYFNVIQQQPNFEGISESKYTTKWVLTSTETTGYTTPVFFDGLTSNSWRLSDYSSRLLSISEGILPTDDTMISEGYPDTNYDGSSTYRLTVGDGGSLQETRALVKYEFFDNYLIENITQNSKLDIYIVSAVATIDVPLQIYKTGDFEEESAVWNNQPSTGDYITTVYIKEPDGVWYTDIDLGSPYEYYKWIDGNQGDSYWCKPNHHESGTSPILYHYISKIYHNTTGEGYAYMQTDTTETLGLKSQIYSQNYSLSEGDFFIVDLETTSSNAQLKLYSNDVLQDVINVLVANTETSRQEVEVYVDSDVSFDQVKITSELDDTEYLKLYDIQAKHWIFESEEDQKSMYVEPFGQNEILVNYGNNSLKIYENDILQIDTYINIGYDLVSYVFESPLPETVFVSYYDSDNEYLDFNLFKTYINYTLYEEEFTNQRLTSREFYVDEASTIYFNTYDSFDFNIYSGGRLAKTLMDIVLPVYSLKIKNEATKETNYTLTKGSISKSGWIFPQEIIEYSIASGTYQLDYVNYEDISSNTYNFSLNENKFIIINSTYFEVYFSIFNFDGLGLDKDLVRFYINNERKDFGFNTLKQDINNLLVLDYFNATLFNQNINLRAYTEYNINVEVYTLILYNNYSHPVKIELERNNIEIEQIIPSWSGLSYRFLPNVEYLFRIYYLNGSLIEEKKIELDSNNKIVSFGFFEEEIPIDPGPIIAGYETMFWFVVFFAGAFGFALVVIILLRRRNNTSRRYYSFPKKTRNKPGTYNNSLAKRRDNDYG